MDINPATLVHRREQDTAIATPMFNILHRVDKIWDEAEEACEQTRETSPDTIDASATFSSTRGRRELTDWYFLQSSQSASFLSAHKRDNQPVRQCVQEH